jgi:hypothetical protein
LFPLWYQQYERSFFFVSSVRILFFYFRARMLHSNDNSSVMWFQFLKYHIKGRLCSYISYFSFMYFFCLLVSFCVGVDEHDSMWLRIVVEHDFALALLAGVVNFALVFIFVCILLVRHSKFVSFVELRVTLIGSVLWCARLADLLILVDCEQSSLISMSRAASRAPLAPTPSVSSPSRRSASRATRVGEPPPSTASPSVHRDRRIALAEPVQDERQSANCGLLRHRRRAGGSESL